jgi:hypothetical protein
LEKWHRLGNPPVCILSNVPFGLYSDFSLRYIRSLRRLSLAAGAVGKGALQAAPASSGENNVDEVLHVRTNSPIHIRLD